MRRQSKRKTGGVRSPAAWRWGCRCGPPHVVGVRAAAPPPTPSSRAQGCVPNVPHGGWRYEGWRYGGKRVPRWGLSVDRLPPLTHVLGRLLFYSILCPMSHTEDMEVNKSVKRGNGTGGKEERPEIRTGNTGGPGPCATCRVEVHQGRPHVVGVRAGARLRHHRPVRRAVRGRAGERGHVAEQPGGPGPGGEGAQVGAGGCGKGF